MAQSTAQRMASGGGRAMRAYRAMPKERRLAVGASIGLFLTMFLPWYQRQFFFVVSGKLVPGSDSQNAWQSFSFVEAAVLLVAIGVGTLLFQRAEGKAFHLPGGDGWVIMVAGGWTCVLVVWRMFDKQGGVAHGQSATSYGIEWGIFVALAAAAFLTYAGTRIRAAHRPEPPLPGESGPPLPATEPAPVYPAPPSDLPAAAVPAEPRPVRPPRPVAADDPPTAPLGAGTDDQLTIPLEPGGEPPPRSR